jgi:hypothetical protein
MSFIPSPHCLSISSVAAENKGSGFLRAWVIPICARMAETQYCPGTMAWGLTFFLVEAHKNISFVGGLETRIAAEPVLARNRELAVTDGGRRS